jgi:glycerophosphoryl diester phosphodiesterase
MIILAHRANLDGPEPATENIPEQVERALVAGFGVETDIRRTADGRFYVSHDETLPNRDNNALRHAALWARHPEREIALNVKEPGYEHKLAEFVIEQNLQRKVFLFDFELIESTAGQTAARIARLHPALRLAARVSDRYGESIERAASIQAASIIWLDEFDSLWVTREHIQQMKRLDRTIYAISPEIHGFSIAAMESRWSEFQRWGVDGICTDFPRRAREFLNAYPER